MASTNTRGSARSASGQEPGEGAETDRGRCRHHQEHQPAHCRHTFGNIAGDKIPVQVLQHLYRHSNITTTINYQGNFVHDKTYSALDKVLDF